jgi:hypothetical protein
MREERAFAVIAGEGLTLGVDVVLATDFLALRASPANRH